MIGVHPSTVSRELKRYKGKKGAIATIVDRKSIFLKL